MSTISWRIWNKSGVDEYDGAEDEYDDLMTPDRVYILNVLMKDYPNSMILDFK